MTGYISRSGLIKAGLGVSIVLAGLLFFLEYHLLVHLREGHMEDVWRETVGVVVLASILVIGLILFSIRRMRDQRRELEARLAAEIKAREALEKALLDPLTGLANRRHFDELFHAVAEKGPVPTHALLLIDLDRFKAVNDVHGHPAGDHVLKVVSHRLQNATKDTDLVARLGGDEFAVVTFHVDDAAVAEALKARLAAVIEETITFGNEQLRVGASIGVTLFPEEGVPASEVFRRADAALYAAKTARRTGR